MQRRSFLQSSAAFSLLGLAGCATTGMPSRAQVVVIGGGYGGATAAKYVRLLSDHKVNVVLIEPNEAFVSCPMSNLVLGGSRQVAEITRPYTGLSKHGVQVVRDLATGVDTQRKVVTLARGGSIGYDKLIVSPGVDLQLGAIEGLAAAHASGQVLQAWKAGPETVALRRQLEAMPDGGTYAITIPEQPYRCPPGPYERACQVAHYFSREKPRSRVLVLDANPDVVSKGALFKRVWKERYGGIVEYRPRFHTVDVEPGAKAAISELGDRVAGDVLNVIPPQRAGDVARQAGLATANGRWCPVDFLTFESTQAPNVHVIGDAIQTAPLMPKSAHMANQHAKVCAAAVVDLLSGAAPQARPMLTNTCYSFVSDTDVIHVASVHAYDEARATFLAVRGSGGLSAEPSELEGRYAHSWAANIWADTLG